VQFWSHRSCPLSESCVSKDKKIVQSVSQKRSDLWSDRRISKWSIVSLDILITLTLYKLARLLSDAELCSRDRINFRTQPRYMVCENALLGHTFEHWNWECILKPGFGCKNLPYLSLNCDFFYDYKDQLWDGVNFGSIIDYWLVCTVWNWFLPSSWLAIDQGSQ